jgi:hypothetical protein
MVAHIVNDDGGTFRQFFFENGFDALGVKHKDSTVAVGRICGDGVRRGAACHDE